MVNYPTIVVNGFLGDCSFQIKKTVTTMVFMSTDKQSLDLKKSMFEKTYGHSDKIYWSNGVSGYGGKKKIYRLHLPSIPNNELPEISSKDTKERILKSITEMDLFLWYLDDGSWHKTKNTMHLYSNMLDERESRMLIGRIEDMYGIAPRLRVDRKKDGRSFYYLYFPRKLVNILHPIFKSYITSFNLTDSYYKVGGRDYEDVQVADKYVS